MKKFLIILFVTCFLVCFGCSGAIPFEDLVYMPTQNITKVVVDVDNANVVLAATNDRPYVEYQQNSRQKIKIKENATVLTVKDTTLIHFGSTGELPTITVYLNDFILEQQKYKLEVSISNGSLTVQNDLFSVINAEVDNGKIIVENVTVTNLNCEVSNGLIKFNSLIANACKAQVSIGEINALALDCLNIDFSVDVGNINISLVGSLEDYKISVDADVGNCNVSPTQTGIKALSLGVDVGNITVDFVG